MSLNYLPGRPNDTQQSMCQASWQDHTIFAYCSGNNLIILSNEFTRLQTIYLETEMDCTAVDINPNNGFIAVSVNNKVNVYKPLHQVMKNPKWTFCCDIFHDHSRVNCLKWGHNKYSNSDTIEIILGSDYLSFWKIDDKFGNYIPILLWNKRQPKPVYLVTVSNDSQLIASLGKFDHSVKLWKRISISGEQDIFNLSLLHHSAPVTSLRWKLLKTNHKSTQILYTLCADKKLRIWSCIVMETGLVKVQDWGSLILKPEQKFCFIIDSWLIQSFLDTLSAKNQDQLPKEYEYFKKLKPDIVLFGDVDGNFEVISLENLSHEPPKSLNTKQLGTVSIPHPSIMKNPNFLYFSEVQPYTFPEASLIVNDLCGKIRHSTLNLPMLLAPTKKDQTTTRIAILEHKFTGHNKSIQRLIRSNDGEALLTVSRFSENCVWCPQQLDNGTSSLEIKNIIKTEAPIKLAVVQEKGSLVICLLENLKIQAWECPDIHHVLDSHLKAEFTFPESDRDLQPLLMFHTPEEKHNHHRHFVAIVYNDGSIRAFSVSFEEGINEVESDSLDTTDDIYRITTIDPVHTTYRSYRPLLSLITKKGATSTYKAIIDCDDLGKYHIAWIKTYDINTGITDALFVRGSSTGKICIVGSDGKSMSLWDMRRGVLEYNQTFEDTIRDVDWTSTEFEQSIVSIGFIGFALLYTQLRYDYTNNTPSYLPIEKIDITSHTAHTIGDSIWLKNGIFVVASGNQLYIKDRTLDLSDPFTNRSIGSRKIISNDILHLNSVLNGPLPVYHPQFLIQALYGKKLQLVKELLLRLFLELRNIDFESMDITTTLSSDLNTPYYKFFVAHDRDYPSEKFPDPYPEFTKVVASALCEQLTKITLPYITRHQQKTLITVIEAMDLIIKNEKTVDYNGIRFLLGVKLFISHRPGQKSLLMRDVSWALHSDNKEIILSLINTQLDSWEKACEFKIAYWIKQSDLLQKFEDIARLEFSKNETKDPLRCAIFYLALKKKQILLSLWKTSIGHPEQQKMVKFLQNDFKEPRWRTAALKNAFVLLSKHRYTDAATFFLLADSLKDAVNVLWKQVGDMDLAIAVCRVYEGDNGPILGDLLINQVLPNAILESDRWMTS